MRSRITTLLAIAMVALGVGGTFAVATQHTAPNASAAATQYHNKHCYNRNFRERHSNACKRSEVKPVRYRNGRCYNKSYRDRHAAACRRSEVKAFNQSGSGRTSPALAGRTTPRLAG